MEGGGVEGGSERVEKTEKARVPAMEAARAQRSLT